MSQCAEPHPSLPVKCVAPERYPNHDNHFANYEGEPVEWRNERYVPNATGDAIDPSHRTFVKQRVINVANQVRGREGEPEVESEDDGDVEDDWFPVVGSDDPWSSHLAAERIEPKRGTRKANVLDVLQDRLGEWVDGYDLVTQDVGGSSGLRRLRELRQEGWPIERRPHPFSETAWQYRLPAEQPLINIE